MAERRLPRRSQHRCRFLGRAVHLVARMMRMRGELLLMVRLMVMRLMMGLLLMLMVMMMRLMMLAMLMAGKRHGRLWWK